MALKLTTNDIKQISKTLYTRKEEEHKTRKIFNVNNEFDPSAQVIGYETYNRKGAAKIFANGGSAKDIPFVGEEMTEDSQTVYTIVSGVHYTEEEIEQAAMRRKFGRGPAVNLSMKRPEAARKYILEKETKIAFLGGASEGFTGLKGIFDDFYYGTGKGKKESVAATGSGSTAADKRLWKNKTPQLILKDLMAAKNFIETGDDGGGDEIFEAKILILSKAAKNILDLPYSDNSPMTVLDWIKKSIDIEVETFSIMKAGRNGDPDNVSYFMLLDNAPENVELSVVRELWMTPADVENLTGTTRMAVKEKTAGMIVRQPSAIYIGKGI